MKLCIVIALTTAVMLMDLNIYADACKPQKWADGCSGVTNFHFTDDCNKHDICYACGKALGVSQQKCDDRFKNNMMNTCNTKVNWSSRSWCKIVAENRYQEYRAYGFFFNKVPSERFCQEAWVRECV